MIRMKSKKEDMVPCMCMCIPVFGLLCVFCVVVVEAECCHQKSTTILILLIYDASLII